MLRNFPSSPVVKTLPSKARGVCLISGYGVKIPRALWPNPLLELRSHMPCGLTFCTPQTHKNQKQYCNKFNQDFKNSLLLLLLSCFSRVRLCATPQTAAHEAPPSLGFSRQEHQSGLPFPSPKHESEK